MKPVVAAQVAVPVVDPLELVNIEHRCNQAVACETVYQSCSRPLLDLMPVEQLVDWQVVHHDGVAQP